MDNMLYINYDVIKRGASWKVHIKRGKLTIYLGYSPGVGKTYEMLSNGMIGIKKVQILKLVISNPINA